MNTQGIEQVLKEIIDKIKRSGALGRSPAYVKLLEYLAEITVSGEVCSEMAVAVDVFNKGDDFDVTSDSTVRVYVYNLRQKLAKYYEEAGSEDNVRLTIPKGAYRLFIEVEQGSETNPKAQKTGERQEHLEVLGGKLSHQLNKNSLLAQLAKPSAIIFLLLVCFFLMVYIVINERFPLSNEQTQFWGALTVDDKPVMIVVGDYYIFGEQIEKGLGVDEIRLVREFDINSARELRERTDQEDESYPYRFDLGLTYLPRGSAFAISNVQDILTLAGKKPRITMMSEFSAEDLRANHIIYIGYISGLDVLEPYMFSKSRFDVGYNYDEVIDTETGKTYLSDFINAEDDRNFVDYGLISRSSISGDSLGENVGDSQLVLLAGTRDAGLMEMSELVVARDVLTRLQLEKGGEEASVSLFEVYGFNLTNISSSLVGNEYIE